MEAKRYKAFISYSHTSDSVFAERLQTALQRFAKRWNQIRAFRVFRDQTNLSIAPGLWPEIEKALGSSEHLLLLASPASPRSKWITRELQYWIANASTSRLYIVVTSGRIEWDDALNEFDWARTTCVPEVLRGAFHEPPLYVDCSAFAAEGTDAATARPSLDDSRFLDAVATIAARLHGKEKDEIFGEHIRQHRKTMRVAWSAGVGLACLAAALGVALTLENIQRKRAEHQTRVATAQRLAVQSQAMLAAGQTPQVALLLAAEALKVNEDADEPRTAAAEEAVRGALARVGGIGLGSVADKNAFLSFSPDGQTLAAKIDKRTVKLWDLQQSDDLPATLIHSDDDLDSVGFSVDSKWLIAVRGRRLTLWRLAANKGEAPLVLTSNSDITTFAMPEDGRLLVAGHQDGTLTAWRLDAGRPAESVTTVPAHDAAVLMTRISRNGRYLVSGSEDKTARVWDLASEHPWQSPRILSGHSGAVSLIEISSDGERIVTAGNHNIPRYWKMGGRSPQPVLLDLIEETVDWLEMSPNGRWLFTSGKWAYASLCDLSPAQPAKSYTVLPSVGGPVGRAVFSSNSDLIVTAAGLAPDELADATTPEPVARVWDISAEKPEELAHLTGHSDVILNIVFVIDGRFVATSSFDGTIRIWNPRDAEAREPLYVLRGHDGAPYRLTASRDGRWLASAGSENTARLWPLADESLSAAPVRMSRRAPAILAASGNGAALFAGDSAFVLWKLAARRPSISGEVMPLPQEMPAPSRAALSHNGRWLATGFGEENKKVLVVWDLKNGLAAAEPSLINVGEATIDGFSLTDQWLLVNLHSDSSKGYVEIWNLIDTPVARHTTISAAPGAHVTAAAIERSSSLVAVGRSNRSVEFLDIAAAGSPRVLAARPAAPESSQLTFTPSGRWLIGRGPRFTDRSVTLWRISAENFGAVPIVLPAHSTAVEHTSVSPDERWLATGAFGDSLRVWPLGGDFSQPWLDLPINAHVAMDAQFSADGRWLATTSYEGATQLWDLSRGRRAAGLPITLRGHVRPLVRMAFSRDSRWLVTADTEVQPERDPAKSCRIWDLTSPDIAGSAVVIERQQLPFGADRVEMSVDGRWLITESLDGLRLWPLGTRALIELSEGTAGRPLSAAERVTYDVPASIRR